MLSLDADFSGCLDLHAYVDIRVLAITNLSKQLLYLCEQTFANL